MIRSLRFFHLNKLFVYLYDLLFKLMMRKRQINTRPEYSRMGEKEEKSMNDRKKNRNKKKMDNVQMIIRWIEAIHIT